MIEHGLLIWRLSNLENNLGVLLLFKVNFHINLCPFIHRCLAFFSPFWVSKMESC